MTPSAEVITVDPCESPLWADAAADASLFESPPWLRVLRDAFGVRPVAHMVDTGDATRSVGVAVCQIDDLIGRRQSTLPFSDYSGPVGPCTDSQWSNLLARILADKVTFKIRTMDPRLARNNAFSETGRAAWHGIDLDGDEEVMWDALDSGARQNIRRARRMGVEVQVETGRAAVAVFEDLHLELRRQKYTMLSQPPEFFDALHHHFPDDLAVVTASAEGRPISGILLLRWGGRAYYKFNASRMEAQTMRANDLAMWQAMLFAQQSWQCELLDLGLSDLDQPGLIRYKEKYARNSGEIMAYKTATPDESPLSSEAADLARNLAGAVAREGTPPDVCQAVSSSIYRYFA